MTNDVWFIPIGVEHLLRDVKDTTISTLATEVSFLYFGSQTSLKGLILYSLALYWFVMMFLLDK